MLGDDLVSVLFREHRSSLDDSMKTVVTVNSRKELFKHIYNAIPYVDRNSVLDLEWYSKDERIGWLDTYLVTLDGRAIGFTNGDLPDEKTDS